MGPDEVLGDGTPLAPYLMGQAPSHVLMQLTQLWLLAGSEEGA